MMKIIKKHKLFFIAVINFLLLFSFIYDSAAANNTSCKKPTCSQIFSSCKPETYAGSDIIKLSDKGAHHIDAVCVAAQAQNGCFDGAPVTCTKNYGGLVNRDYGKSVKYVASAGKSLRNHQGVDLGANGCPNPTQIGVKAAADGRIVFAGNSGGGGRTIMISHTGNCSGGGGAYATIYRHLAAYKRKSGEVKKGEIIGIEGGSNFSPLCDHGQKNCSSYNIHLHFELVMMDMSKAMATGVPNSKLMEPYCNDLQALCGGCSSDVKCGIISQGNGHVYKDGQSIDMTGFDTGSDPSYGDVESSACTEKCCFSDYLDSNNCVFCDLFKTIYNAASDITLNANRYLSGPCKEIVMIGFMIWICLYILKIIANASQQTTFEMLKGILFQGFRVAVVVYALGGGMYEILDLTLNPAMLTGLRFAETFNEKSTCPADASYMQGIAGYDLATGFPNVDVSNTLTETKKSAESATENNSEKATDSSKSKEEPKTTSGVDRIGGLPADVGRSILCNVKKLEDSVGFLLSLGKFGMCTGIYDRPFIAGLLPGFAYLISGLFIFICGLLLLLAFPWALIDCTLQLCVAGSLMPCAVASYAFKVTEQYIKKVWNFFMNAMFNFVFMTIIIFIINKCIVENWLGYNPGKNPNPDIFRYLTGDDFTFMESLAWFTIGPLKILLITAICSGFFEEAGKMAKEFASGASIHVGGKVGGTMAQLGAAAGKITAVPAGKAALEGIKAGGRSVGNSINSKYGNTIRNNTRKLQQKALSMLPGAVTQRNSDGTTTTKATLGLLGMRKNFEFTQDKDGNISRSVETRRRTNAEKHFRRREDENGNISYISRSTGERMQSFTDKNGNTVFQTANGKERIVVDKNGNELNFNLNANNQNSQDQKVYNRRAEIAVSQNGVKSVEMRDHNGNVLGRKFDMQDQSLKDLINKDGTTNMEALKKLTESGNTLTAEAAVIFHLKQRGYNINESFQNRHTEIDSKTGEIIITQTNNDGSEVKLNARMDGRQMIIKEQQISQNGNVMIRTSNGIQHKTQTLTKQKDGSYISHTKMGFSNHTLKNNVIYKPLNSRGEWGMNINREDAMRGFTQEDFDAHVAQLVGNAKAQIFDAVAANISGQQELSVENILNLNELINGNKAKKTLKDYVDVADFMMKNKDSHPNSEERIKTLQNQARAYIERLKTQNLSEQEKRDIAQNKNDFIKIFGFDRENDDIYSFLNRF